MPPLIVALFRVKLPPLPTARIRKLGEPLWRLMLLPLPSMVMALVTTGKPLLPLVMLFTEVRVTFVCRSIVSAPLPATQSIEPLWSSPLALRIASGREQPSPGGNRAGAVGHRDGCRRAGGANSAAVQGQQQRDPGQAQAELALQAPPLGPWPAPQALVPVGETPEQVGPALDQFTGQ